tara:strand:- start:172 stop:381 length:210 start_codon:yes stop_codon:yes gene_type:complete
MAMPIPFFESGSMQIINELGKTQLKKNGLISGDHFSPFSSSHQMEEALKDLFNGMSQVLLNSTRNVCIL